ncbi:universal stress protein [Streptomyces sp. NPDC058755]|uniref:universal stress protein n=1 Tax=Streptomyces sp. NPDC058755 TaxID=3346624 RepID=UPI0036B8B746
MRRERWGSGGRNREVGGERRCVIRPTGRGRGRRVGAVEGGSAVGGRSGQADRRRGRGGPRQGDPRGRRRRPAGACHAVCHGRKPRACSAGRRPGGGPSGPGSRGHGGCAEALLGSVGRHCVQHAPCPVVVIRGPRCR